MNPKIIRLKDILSLIVLLVIGLIAAALFRSNYLGPVVQRDYPSLSPEAFINLVDQKTPRVWFYMHVQHEQRYQGLLGTDPVQTVYVVEENTAIVYQVKGKSSLRFNDLKNLGPSELIKKLSTNTLDGFEVSAEERPYSFKAELLNNSDVKLIIKRKDNIKDQNAFNQVLDPDELVTGLSLNGQTYAGFFHEARSSDRFLKYHTNALITLLDENV